jgi:hypothetical protein
MQYAEIVWAVPLFMPTTSGMVARSQHKLHRQATLLYEAGLAVQHSLKIVLKRIAERISEVQASGISFPEHIAEPLILTN